MPKRILCLDFDGVCHSYTSKWEGPEHIPDPPVDGLWEFLHAANAYFELHIFSARSAYDDAITAMICWFAENYKCVAGDLVDVKITQDSILWIATEGWCQLHFPSEKPAAFLTIDDRAMLFTGQWPNPQQLLDFKTWNEARKHK